MTELVDTMAPTTDYWPGRYRDQVVLVTGAAGGLAAPTCRRLAREGATVICTDVAGDGDGSSPEACLSLDVTDPEAWSRVVADIMRTHGRLDGALLAHGVQGPETPIDETPRDGWQRTLAINLDGCLHGLGAALPAMRARGYGRVTILSSIAGREGNPHQAAYSASKAAVISLVKTAAKEYARDGITVNAVAPSMMRTRMLDDLSEERNAALLARVPMGRVGTPEEFAALAAWLLSPEASYTTGQTLDLSGGRNTA
ncbi:SDR family NAD(P)-dependent oxidoreductase [Streptomyces sp. NPDC102360]|uniref:SDR family NAD(P)-dependent oxidoreductase n=1 Tax=Streptomyces sp. NPDC102360 TaxID=3366160 RepID=UPI00380645B0